MTIRNVIVACDYAYIEGGAARVAVQTAVELSKRSNLKVYFFAGCGEPCQELVQGSVQVISLGMYDLLGNPSKLDAMKKGIYNRKAGKLLEDLLNTLKENETIIHVHTWTKVLSSAIFAIADKKNIPVFLTVHDYFLTCPNGGCYDYVKNEICERKPMSFNCVVCNCDSRHYYYKVWRCMRQFRQNRVMRNCKNIRYIFISEFEKKQLVRRFGEPKWQFMLKNPSTFSERKRVLAEKNEIYLYIGRVSEEKGVPLFCEAVENAGVKAVVVGDGGLKKDLEKKYPDITFTGWLEKAQIDQWIEKSRCLIFPSRWYEGSPLTVPEVQAYGIPCIVTDCSAAVDNIVTEKNGLIVKADGKEMCSAIAKMANDEIVAKMSYNTFELFDEKSYSNDVYIKNLLQIYEKGV